MAIASATASAMFPGLGLMKKVTTDFTAEAWYALVAPKGPPPEIVQHIQKVVAAQLEDPATRAGLRRHEL